MLRTCLWISKRGNLVDKVLLLLVGTFSPPGSFENGLAVPASTREKSTRISSKNYWRDAPRSPCIYVWASPVFPVAPLFCGPAVVRVAFWCSGAVEPLPGTSWQLVRWCGPPGLANFDFRARFLWKCEELFLLGLCRFEPASCEHGLVFTVRVSWLWVVCGCSPGPAASWQPCLDDVGRKNCV